jgi:glycosyltransferase involved in cell wall biosynthesis
MQAEKLIIMGEPGVVTNSRNGVHIEKSLTPNEQSGLRIEIAIESDRESPVAVRIHDTVPEGTDTFVLSFGTGHDGDHWRVFENSHLEFSRIITPRDSILTAYSVRGPECAAKRFSAVPTIDRVQLVDPEQVEDGNRDARWRGSATATFTPKLNEERNGLHPDGEQLVDEPEPSPLLLSRDSEATPTLSIVLPTLDEEQGIGECIEKAKRAIGQLGVTAELIISDSSTDTTPNIARERGAIVVSPDKLGYGYAYRYAFEHARGEYIAIADADTTYDFEDLPRLLDLVAGGDADIAMGSRLQGEIESGAMPRLHQYIGNPVLTKFLNVFYGAGVTDAHSGFRVISREALERLDLQCDGMEFASEMIMHAGAKGLRIEEVPITYHERKGEATLSSFRDGWRHVKFMLTNAPSCLFSAPATLFGILGAAMMVLSLLETTIGGIYLGTHTVIAGTLLVISGYQVGGFALISAIATDPIREQQDPITDGIRQNVHMEHALTLGLLLLIAGGGYIAYVVLDWIASGYDTPPFDPIQMFGFVAVVLGIQTMFTAFLASMLKRERQVW